MVRPSSHSRSVCKAARRRLHKEMIHASLTVSRGRGSVGAGLPDAASSFNRELTEQMGAITAKDTRVVGAAWNFAPILDIATHPAWARVYEVGLCPVASQGICPMLMRDVRLDFAALPDLWRGPVPGL